MPVLLQASDDYRRAALESLTSFFFSSILSATTSLQFHNASISQRILDMEGAKMRRALFVMGLTLFLAACGSTPQVLEPQSAPRADAEIPPGYGYGSATVGGKEVSAYTAIKRFRDTDLDFIDENTLAGIRSVLSEEEIASLSPAKQRALRAARFQVKPVPSQRPPIEARRNGQPIDLFEAMQDLPASELATFPDETKAAIYRALTPEQRGQLSADKRELLERSIRR